MTQLVILVVGAAWAAVLIPPMLRSRIDNRPNSSVTDFRRQLNRLQSTATPPRGAARAMGRPLAQSPLQRQAAPGRPGQPPAARQPALRGGTAVSERPAESPRYRSHGDPTGGQRRPDEGRTRRPAESGDRGPSPRAHGADRARTPQRQRAALDPATQLRRRRTNVVFFLVTLTACTMFLAVTTDSTFMLWALGISFVSTFGYLYKLAQLRELEQTGGWDNNWLDHR